jgi:NADPH:quinone reductase-like Zn-dependent oxidoreductase
MKTLAEPARIVAFKQTGGPEVIDIENVEVPAPNGGEVRIRPRFLGLNRADSMYREGQYVEPTNLPGRLGYEAAGIVEAIGTEVTHVQLGDVVSIIPAFSLHQYAMHGTLVLAPAYAVEKHPEGISLEEATALWTTYLTAYGLLVDTGQIESGQYVVINAASGGVGLSAIQITNAAGGIPIALTTSASKKEALLKAGAVHVIVTSEEDLLSELQVITGGSGVDIIIDAVGGPAFADLIKAAAYKARILVYGVLSPAPAPVSTMDILSKNLNILGFSVAGVNTDPVRLTAAKEFIYKGLAEGTLKPVIDKVFAFEDIVEAYRYLDSNKQVGKILVAL